MRRLDSCIFCAILRRRPTIFTRASRLGAGRFARARGGRRRRACRGAGEVGVEIGLHDAARRAAGLHGRQVDAELPRSRTDCRRGERPCCATRVPVAAMLAVRCAGRAPSRWRKCDGGGSRRRLRGRDGGGRRRGCSSGFAALCSSMRISSAPTASICPTSPPSASTRPATGEGISTVALSVITSASSWSSATASPGLTRQATSSTSAMPSPRSGIGSRGCHHSITRLNAAATRSGPGK